MIRRVVLVIVVLFVTGCGSNVDWLRLCVEAPSHVLCVARCAECLSEHRDPVEVAGETCASECAECLAEAAVFVTEAVSTSTEGAACPAE